MTWLQAREQTLDQWRRVYRHIGVWPLERFLAEVSVEWPICCKAKEEGQKHRIGSCMCCPAFQQMGGCNNWTGHLMRAALKRDWRKVEIVVAHVIDYWENVKVPFPMKEGCHNVNQDRSRY